MKNVLNRLNNSAATGSGVTAEDVVASIEMILGRTPDQGLVDYHLGLGFADRFALGEYMMTTQEFKSRFKGERPKPLFLGDRVMAYTYRGEVIYLLPSDLDLTPGIIINGTHEPAVERVIVGSIRAGDTAVDIGANVGYHTLAIASAVGPNGQVHAFEANPDVMHLLQATMVINRFTSFRGTGRVNLYQKAVCDAPGVITLEAAPGHYGSGHVVTASPLSDFGPEYSSRVEVPAVTLDSMLADSRPVDFLHMDIEGAEPIALKGAQAVIDRSPTLRIVTEWSVGMMRTLSDVDSCIGSLVERGFKFWLIGSNPALTPVEPSQLTGLPHCDLFISRDSPPQLD